MVGVSCAGVVLALAACTSSVRVGADDGGDGTPAGQAARTPSAGPTGHEYLPGLLAFPHLPPGVSEAPVVVMVPGGGWQTADPTGLAPLAATIAAEGAVAVPVEIRAAEDGVVHPTPIEDVLCALADASATVEAAGIRPSRLVLLGHSSGAHLSAVATLDPTGVTPRCEDPVVAPDALVGLAGPYDIRAFADAAARLFPADADEATWDAANPVLLADHRPQVPVLLLHGGDDDVVPVQFSEDFAQALRTAGHPTTLTIQPGVDHTEVYSPAEAAEPVVRWLGGLSAPS